MNIEIKLALNNMKKNIKRTLFTTISIILCIVLLFTTMLVISSIKNGINENFKTNYNDYHFIIKKLDIDDFNKIKQKEYIEKIYIQENDTEVLKELKSDNNLINVNNINVYIKYKNIRKTEKYSTDIIKTIELSTKTSLEKTKFIENCSFNKNLLMIHGLIDVGIAEENYSLVCKARLNYSYVLDIMLIIILVVFSVIFIIILYNAFLITINERRKEYAILNSVGGTEGQILKILFIEIAIMGIIGIIFGGLISSLCANIILKLLNNILINTGYVFKLIFDIKYYILSIFIIVSNLYISALIPSVKASTTSVIQRIRNNNEIKYKKRTEILEKIFSVEGRIAIKNIKRNKNKYKVITILFVICMTSYIVISTYINYEKETSELVTEYDVDAKLVFDSKSNMDYKSILKNYEIKYEDKIDYMEYKMLGVFTLIEPEDALMHVSTVEEYEDGKKSINMLIIGLDNKTYNKYIKELNANDGDLIIYNNSTQISEIENKKYIYLKALKENYNLKLSIIAHNYNEDKAINEYEIIDNENLNEKIILTDKLIDGYKEIKTVYKAPAIFVNLEKYNKIEEKFNNYTSKNSIKKWIWNDYTDEILIKVKSKNIIGFSNYIENISKKINSEIYAEYYSLANQEKIIYIEIIHLILRVLIISIIIIGIVSTTNIINASLCEREQDFKILHSLGATKENINKILIFECIYMFIKAVIISIILSTPIIYEIIKYMENIIVLDKLLIPFRDIFIFLGLIFLVSLTITMYSSKTIKSE